MEFYRISAHMKSNGVVEIYPKFVTGKKSDLMIKGGDFYAVWIEEKKLWSTDEEDVIKMIDRDLDRYLEENKGKFPNGYSVKYMWDADSGSIDKWHKYVKQQQRDNFVMLDGNVIFSNQETTKESYASRKLSYPLLPGPTTAWDSIMDVLYSPEEKMKLEWAIGAVVSGDSKKIQKFIVLYGDKGTGKGTYLKILAMLFKGYTSSFEAKVVVSGNSAFPLESFRTNPVVAIDSDGDLGSIGDNTRLNALTSHEVLPLNTKNEKVFNARINSFLFIGSNKPVKITDAKSGLLRRLIDVSPTGNKIPTKQYEKLMHDVEFELGAIASHCLDVYKEKPDRYNDYVPMNMMGITNDFYNFIQENYLIFKKDDGVTLKVAWEMYKAFCEETNISKPFPQRIFRDELRNYFKEYYERYNSEDGSRPRKYYKGFRTDKFEMEDEVEEDAVAPSWIVLKEQSSLLDILLADCLAQYPDEKEDRPDLKWKNCKTKLKDLDTSKYHYILPEGHRDLIRIDFDLKNEKGEKDLENNLKEASKWPKTYGEVSKSGGGIHLYYIYSGDPSKLSKIYAPDIEIKVNTGNSSIRRKLTKCNDIPIATISSGLPLKGDDKVVNEQTVLNERQLRTFIKRALNKEHHGATKPEVDFIFKVLEDKYKSGEKYDVSDMRNAVLAFAASSTHQSDAAVKLVAKMHFKSDDELVEEENDIPKEEVEKPIAFFDIEVFPNLVLICWKLIGEKEVHKLFNPRPVNVQNFVDAYRLVGFNNRSYDNHILYALILGYSVEEVFMLSQKMINEHEGFFRDAYNISYADIYDISSKKQSLKKWEFDLDITHQELSYKWDEPVPEDLWPKVAEYCCNDVEATEAVWNDIQADVNTRKVLADLSGLSIMDTNRMHITKILVGNEKDPGHVYTDFATGKQYGPHDELLPPNDIINKFDGYEMVWTTNAAGKKEKHNMYRGTDVGFGGYVDADPGIYYNVALLDVGNMHGASILALNKFWKNTKVYKEIRDARMALKAHDYDKLKTLLDGKLMNYVKSDEDADNLQQALKLILNSTYGIAAATFKNPLADPRDVNNIIALRGALFMRTLQDEVVKKGFKVVHIKTDSIKVPGATPELIDFIMEFGRKYGYEFEHEATYEKMCLVNDAVYIAKYDDKGVRNKGGKHAGEWTATGKEFQVPYVFKKLFSHENVIFKDFCEMKSVKKGSFYLNFNENLVDDNYVFVGRVGLFCPIRPGFGGGELMINRDDKFVSAAGAKGYRWKEAEVVKTLGKENEIDISYYDRLCDEAIKHINEAGEKNGITFDQFVSDYIPNPIDQYESDDDLPF